MSIFRNIETMDTFFVYVMRLALGCCLFIPQKNLCRSLSNFSLFIFLQITRKFAKLQLKYFHTYCMQHWMHFVSGRSASLMETIYQSGPGTNRILATLMCVNGQWHQADLLFQSPTKFSMSQNDFFHGVEIIYHTE